MTDPTNATIEIRSLADFLKVPADKRAHCLTDFLLWLALHDQMIARFGEDAAARLAPRSGFTWLDDGKHEIFPQFVTEDRP